MSGGALKVYSLSEARAARDEGVRNVLAHGGDWPILARAAANFFIPYDVELIGEDIRRILTSNGLREPHHPNAWGGFNNGLVRRGLLIRTGDERQMRKITSHARRSALYVRQSERW